MAGGAASRRPTRRERAGPGNARRRLASGALFLAALWVAVAVPAGATIWENIARSRLTRFRGEARLGWMYDWIQLEGNRVSWDNGLLQYYDLGVAGYVWSPKFLRFNADGNYQGKDVGYDEGPVRAQANSDSFNYSSSLTLLPDHMFPVTAYAQRTDTTIDPDFSAPYPVNNTIFGGDMTVRYRPMPIRVGASNTHFVNKNPVYEMDSSTTQTFLNLRNETTRDVITEAQYQFTRVDDHLRPQDYDSHEAWASNRVWFGATNRSQNFVRADYLRTFRERTPPRDNIDAADTLLLHHTKSLESNYAYTFRYLAEEPARTASHAARVGVRHQLYESLLSRATVDGGFIESADGNQEYAGGSAGVNYTKTFAPVTFRLGGVGNYRHDFWQNFGSGDGSNQVFAEEHQLFSERPELLLNPNVVAGTVIVHDATTQRLFIEDVDYRVLPRGSRTYIARLASGNIVDGGFVLVDYRFQPPAEAQQQTVGWGGNAGLSITPSRYVTLHGSYRYDETQQWTESEREKNHTHDIEAGVEATWMFFTIVGFYNRMMTPDYRFSSYGGSITLTASPSPVTSLLFTFRDLDLYYDDPYLGVDYKKHYDAEFTASTFFRRMLLLTWNSRYQSEVGGNNEGSTVYSKGVATLKIRGIEVAVGASWELRLGGVRDMEEKKVWTTVGRKF
jgi:opacity protein-like surface antigen